MNSVNLGTCIGPSVLCPGGVKAASLEGAGEESVRTAKVIAFMIEKYEHIYDGSWDRDEPGQRSSARLAAIQKSSAKIDKKSSQNIGGGEEAAPAEPPPEEAPAE